MAKQLSIWCMGTALALLASACSTTLRTEVIVVVDSDMAVPSALDALSITIARADGTDTRSSTAALGGSEPPLPRTMGLVHETGSLGPFDVVVVGLLGGVEVVRREARFSFIKDRTLMLRMDLLQSCVGMTAACAAMGADMTCGPGGCRPRQVLPSELVAWPGSPPPLDSGMIDGGGMDAGDTGPAPDAGDTGPLPDAGDTGTLDTGTLDTGTLDTGTLDTGTPDTCVPGPQTCNGRDDDCNGMIDDGYVPMATTCGVGFCASTGVTSCVAGVELDSCVAGSPAATDATCDDVDNNCNGRIDEGYVAAPTTCGAGPCASTGTMACMGGVVADTCMAGTPGGTDTTCDGRDDNCNGMTDEGYVPVPTSCGTGPCAATGMTSCAGGAVSDSCTPGMPGPSDTTCNGVDDNCNGMTDEGYVGGATSCGIGACAASGVNSCVGGAVSNSCMPGVPAASDANCNGIDDNCNGMTDEGYSGAATACGVGACVAAGSMVCTGGVVSNSCMPGMPAPSDATCNGIDDNCNGMTDEGYVGGATACGVGACAATGVNVCMGGVVSSNCTPGMAAPSDATCNGIDDNCNGMTDEGYVGMATTCGVGACAATGAMVCAGGMTSDSCTAGVPAPSDATCDGVDDNCNGMTDEGYVAGATTCGVGACTATGATSCMGGMVSSSCTPGAPAANDATCNGVDDDCNGVIDNGATCPCTQVNAPDGTSYMFCTATRMGWANAETACMAAGYQLATIDSAAEQMFVFGQAELVSGGRKWWIGLNDVATEGTFVWSSGSTSTYRNWRAGEPDNAGKNGQGDCVWFNAGRGSGVWEDEGCTSRSERFICEASP